MRTKSFAMLAVSSLFAASLMYVAPAMAEEFGNELPMEQTLADNSSTGSPMSVPSSNGTQAPSNSTTSQQGDTSGNTSSSSPNSGSTTVTTDEGNPDTAAGDDDY